MSKLRVINDTIQSDTTSIKNSVPESISSVHLVDSSTLGVCENIKLMHYNQLTSAREYTKLVNEEVALIKDLGISIDELDSSIASVWRR